jgi:hypothetical protein
MFATSKSPDILNITNGAESNKIRRTLIPQTLEQVDELLNKDTSVQEGDELPAYSLSEASLKNKLTFERVVYDAKGTRSVITDSIDSLKFGNTIILLMPGAGTHTCSKIHLDAFVKTLAEFKKQGVKVAVLTKDNCDILDALWLRPQLQQADWVKNNPALLNSPTLVQDHIIGIADISLSILNEWGIKPIHIPRLGLVPPRGLIFMHDGKVLRKSIETNPDVCSISSAETALGLLNEFASEMQHPAQKVTIVGAGIGGALEAYFVHKDAQANGRKVRITMLDKNPGISDTTTSNIAPSLTPDEIMSVVPPAPILIEKLGILFSQPGGIRVDDVAELNNFNVKDIFIKQVQEYNKDESAHKDRSQALLKLGKISMDLWQKIYDGADTALKQILEESNFQPCREPKDTTRVLHDGYRIDLIYNIPNAADKAKDMKEDYVSLGYTKCKILSPTEVIELDPFLKDFCNSHTEISPSGIEKVWKNDTVALFRPGGCLDAEVFLPKFYAYLERSMGTYRNEAGDLKHCFRLKFNREVTGVVFRDSPDHLTVSALMHGETTKSDKHTYSSSDYVFCPGEAVGTLKRLRFDEPAYAGFAGASLKLNIPITTDKIDKYKTFNHCMEVHREGVVLAWQARYRDGKIFIAVAGTKAFYADQKPHKDQDFAKNRNLLQFNMINDVLPEFISIALKRDTRGQQLTESDLETVERDGMAKRWVGTRAVAFDGFPTLGSVYLRDRLVENARTTTHLGSGGGSFAPGAVFFSRSAFNKLQTDTFTQKIMKYASSNRRMVAKI